MKKNKIKMLSASALTLLALTGTAYATDLVELPQTRESVPESSQGGTESTESTQEESVESEVNDSTESAEDVESAESEQEQEESTSEGQPEVTESSESEQGAESQEVNEESEEESDTEVDEEPEAEEVDETKVVPEAELPISEATGLLDFAEYHKIAKGRALPRELTEEEAQYFEDFVVNGEFEEVRNGVTEMDYKLIKLYPQEYYISEEGLELKWDKATAIYSELLPLDQQAGYLESRKAEEQELIAQGFVYDKEAGEFIQQQDDSGDVLHGIDNANDTDGVFSPEPVENDDVVQEIHYQEKAIFEDLAEYDGLTANEFLDAYGANFLFRGVVPAEGFIQKEYDLGNGLTLAVEVESNQEEGDNVFLSWGVVKEPIRHERGTGDRDLVGKYNFSTNELHEFYIEGNVLSNGGTQIRTDGRYTPTKVHVEYEDEKGIPHAYLLVADTVLSGEDQRRFSELVGYIEYGWENIYEDGYENEAPSEGETPDEETPTEEEPESETPNGGNTGGNGGTGNENGNGDETNGEQDEETDEGRHDSLPDWVKPIDLDKDGIISKDEAIKAGYGNDLPLQEGHPLAEFMEDANVQADGSEVNEGNEGEEKGSERFQQTGTSIIWGAIVSGLGLGAIGAYIRKKSNKDKKVKSEDKKED